MEHKVQLETTHDGTALTLFRDKNTTCKKTIHNNSIIDGCDYLKRLSLALQYYNNCERFKKDWIEICFNNYGYVMLDDYAHLLSVHGHELDLIKVELIKMRGFVNCKVVNCQFSLRHFNRNIDSIDEKNYTNKLSFYEQEYDSLHFNLFHLFQTGYRIKRERSYTNDGSNNNDYINCVDNEFTEMIKTINNDRDKYKKRFQRFKTKKK
eukprot:534513_1